MARVRKYRIWCVTEGRHVYVWSIGTPAQCPNNSNDTIDTDSIIAIQGAGKPRLTASGDTVTVKKDRAELDGNLIVMKRIDAELAPEATMSKEWVLPYGKSWHLRLFASSVMSFEVEARLEFLIPDGQGGFVRVNPFDGHSDEPISALKLDGNSDSAPFYEGLRFVGDGSSKLRLIIQNKDALDSVEASAYFNGYELNSNTPSAPVVNAPLSAGAVSVSGTSAEPDGMTIQVYVNGTAASTAVTVTGGTWTRGGLAALVSGDELQAKATDAGGNASMLSNKVTAT